MVRTIKHGNLQRLNLVTSENTVGHSGLEALLDARDEFLRNITTLDLIVELKSGNAFIGRSDLDDDVGELTTTTGLLLEDLTVLYCSGDSLFVVNLRSALIDLDTELTTETVHDDVKVKLTHSADDCLAGLVV